MLQILWDVRKTEVLEREQRALQQAESELGFSGRIISVRDYLRDFIHSIS